MYQSFYTGALGAGSFMAKMGVMSNNLANINNNGFKPKNVAFTDLLQYNLNDSEEAVTELMAGNGIRIQRTYNNYDISSFTPTESDIDFAIADKNAFFMVQDPATGEITYTRTGHFHRGERPDGFYLTTDSGKLVLDEERNPIRAVVPEFDTEEGQENAGTDERQQTPPLYTFSNPSRLFNVGDNEYTPPAGMEPQLVDNPNLIPRALERSGTDMAKEMVQIIECQRAYSYALKMVTTSDDIESTINSLRG